MLPVLWFAGFSSTWIRKTQDWPIKPPRSQGFNNAWTWKIYDWLGLLGTWWSFFRFLLWFLLDMFVMLPQETVLFSVQHLTWLFGHVDCFIYKARRNLVLRHKYRMLILCSLEFCRCLCALKFVLHHGKTKDCY